MNVFTEAINSVVAEEKSANGEFFCIVERVGAIRPDELTVLVEVPLAGHREAAQARLAQRPKEVVGLRVVVRTLAAHELDEQTGVAQVSKVQ